MLSSGPLRFPDGTDDPYHVLRPVVGYGPETLSGVLAHQYSPRGADPKRENRFHNQIWDLWASIGVVGIFAFHAVFVLTFFYVYRRLDLIASRCDIAKFWTMVIAFAVGGASCLTVWLGAGFFGIGLQVGAVAGLTAFPMVRCLRKHASRPSPSLSEKNATLLIVLVSALAGHWVETSLSFSVVATSTMFWVYTGVIMALTCFAPPATGSTEVPSVQANNSPRKQQGKAKAHGKKLSKNKNARRRGPTRWEEFQPALLSAVITNFMIVPLLFSFVHVYSRQDLSSGAILSHALTQLEGHSGAIYVMPMFIIFMWIASTFALTVHEFLSGTRTGWAKQFWLSLFMSGVALCFYARFKAGQIGSVSPFPTASESVSTVIKMSKGYENIYFSFMAISLGWLLLGGYVCSLNKPEQVEKPSRTGLTVGIIALLGALVFSWTFNLNVARAGVCEQWATALHSQGVRPTSIEVYKRAVQLNPRVYYYHSQLSHAILDQAVITSDAVAFNEMMTQAEKVLLDAQQISALNRCSLHLGQLYMIWAGRETQPDRIVELAKKGSQALATARMVEPYTEFVWYDSFILDRVYLQREVEGAKKLQRAFELSNGQDPQAFGDYYLAKSRGIRDENLQEQYALQAARYYDKR